MVVTDERIGDSRAVAVTHRTPVEVEEYIAPPPLLPEEFQVRLSPHNQPIPIPEYLGPDWRPNWDAIPERTPKPQIRHIKNDSGVLLYKSVTIAYVIRTLDKVFRGHNWGTEIIREGWSDTQLNNAGSKEYVCVLQVVGPGMFRPVIGVGSNVFNKANRQDTEAKTRAAAYTAALKNAAKQMGIGRDLDEDDPDVMNVINGHINAIQLIWDRLKEGPLAEEARAVMEKLAPEALLATGGILTSQIDTDDLEKIQRELTKLGTKAAVNGSKAS